MSRDYGPGFRYSKTLPSDLVHPLQRLYPHLFMVEDSDVAGKGSTPGSSPLGTGGQPRPIQSGLVYEKLLKKQATDTVAMFRACGHFKERLLQRVMQELWGGLEFGVDALTATRGSNV